MANEIRKVVGSGSYEDFLAGEGVQFGYGLFETMAAKVDAVGIWSIQNLEGHMHRLAHSALKMDMPLPPLNEITSEIRAYVHDLSMLIEVGDSVFPKYLAIKLTVLKNKLSCDLLLSHRTNPYPSKINYHEGVHGQRLKLSELVRDEKSLLTYHKTTNYLVNLLEKRKAVEDQYDDCFFLNRQGYISETTVANLFFIKKGQILTPAVNCGILPGTARALILKQAEIRGVSIQEVFLKLEDLKNLDGAAVCNALMGIMPVKTMVDRHFDFSDGLADGLRNLVEEALCEYF